MDDTASTPTDDAIDPEVARFVAAILEGGARAPGALPPSLVEQRALAETIRRPWRQGGPEMARTRDLNARADGVDVRVRVFEPEPRTGAARPALIYVHGGGFTLFSLDTHDRVMREYAGRAGLVVIGVDYSLSPEARFPVALNEVVAAIEWTMREAGALAIDPRRIAIGGDSAGANLSLAACLARRDRGATPPLAGMLFNYGFFDADFDTPSQRRHGDPGKLLTRDELAGYLDHYLGDAPRDNPLALPALAALHDLPPSLHVIAACDPLADGDRMLARRMEDAGNEVTAIVYPGATHSFLEAVAVARVADQAFADSATWLTRLLAGAPAPAL